MGFGGFGGLFQPLPVRSHVHISLPTANSRVGGNETPKTPSGAARRGRTEQLPQFESVANCATKMLRTFAVQAETLANLRRGGEQKVTVEHVHVYPGGRRVTPSHGGPLSALQWA
jgi:hypothetical protein